jgi:hypothetical protein
MLTQEQIIKYSKWITNCDSVMDAHGSIMEDLGRTLTEEEFAQISEFRSQTGIASVNSGSEAQNESICRTEPVEVLDIAPAPVDKVTRMQQLASQIAETYRRKNADYGDSLGISVRKYGIIAALTRMSDKWNRLENLILHREKQATLVADESVLDTLLDLATYCMMTVMEIEEGN